MELFKKMLLYKKTIFSNTGNHVSPFLFKLLITCRWDILLTSCCKVSIFEIIRIVVWKMENCATDFPNMLTGT